MTLTREEILAMEPGPTLDEITAEIACGRKVRMLNEVTNNSFKPQYDKKVIDEGAGRYNIIPRYSTDISAAWEVEERIKEMAIDAPLYIGYYMTELQLIVGNKGFDMVHATPEQRCKAALLAVMGL
ncbi:BC1872 family protein [Paenibacillus sp. B2(2019)]|uniref:BC1872 family protein n=1 Tax=Paenibacillus sp. B2(2019) TaxID=2607754 RepID=UPI0011F155DE|nr:hypothetical protein [Paenibacillus sp. B2(2019)]KAA1180677.1 hypothetical protein PAENI_25845 [Paenibacillus sp. B2(2019)]